MNETLQLADWLTIAFYLLFMLCLGPVFKSFSKNASDYFRGGGNMSWWIAAAAIFMTGFSAWTYTGAAGKIFNTGIFFLTLTFSNFCGAVFTVVFTAHKFRQMRVITGNEAIRNRFGRVNEQINTWLPLPFNIMFSGISLFVIAKFMSCAFVEELRPFKENAFGRVCEYYGLDGGMVFLILILMLVIIVMTVVGGSWAAAAGDFVQMLMLVSVTLAVFFLSLYGDIKVPERLFAYFDGNKTEAVQPAAAPQSEALQELESAASVSADSTPGEESLASNVQTPVADCPVAALALDNSSPEERPAYYGKDEEGNYIFRVGGFSGLWEKIKKEENLTHITKVCRWWILIPYLLTLILNQTILQNALSSGAARFVFVKTGRDARLISAISWLVAIPHTIVFMVPALICALIFTLPDLQRMYPALVGTAQEAAFVQISRLLLPAGLVGLLISAVFAATLTSMNASLNSTAGSIIRNIYLPLVNPNASEERQVWLGRFFTGLMGVLYAVVAILFSTLKDMPLYELILLAASATGIPSAVPLLLGMFHKKAPDWAAWSTLAVGFSFSIALALCVTSDNLKEWCASYHLSDEEVNDLKLAIFQTVLIVGCFSWFYFCMILHAFRKKMTMMWTSSALVFIAWTLAFWAKIMADRAPLDPMRVVVSSAIAFVIAVAWAWVCTLLLKRYPSTDEARVEQFFYDMNRPIDLRVESAAKSYNNDVRQFDVVGKLCVIYGLSILALLIFNLIHGTWHGFTTIFSVGGCITLLGAWIVFYGKMKASWEKAANAASE